MQSLTAILPCTDLDASERFYRRLGFVRHEQEPAGNGPDPYRILENADGQFLHLQQAESGWLVPGRNPFGLYYTLENVDRLAGEFAAEIIGAAWAEDKPWGMYEFAIADPDGTLIRIGWPTRLRQAGGAAS